MLKKEAKEITGGLTYTTKMPGPSFNTPASRCQVGSALRKVPGSVCSSCYALKGNYKRFPKVEEALERRFQSLKHPDWVAAMIKLITGHKFFRWHDAGDLQSRKHLENIFEVCTGTPDTEHWMPTREARILKDIDPAIVPTNLIIRMSSHMIDQKPVKFWPWTSTVTSAHDASCPAPSQGNECKSCRACWDRSVPTVSYGKH
tara:strand:- start:1474 stop:2079 length:606 start_codon:yes stop_codon:yes gene_type:complete